MGTKVAKKLSCERPSNGSHLKLLISSGGSFTSAVSCAVGPPYANRPLHLQDWHKPALVCEPQYERLRH